MASDVQIVNLALTRVGNTALIDSLSDDTTEARTASAVYVMKRENLLQRRDWLWARGRQTLALTAESRTGWRFVYALPADCLKPVSVPYPDVPTTYASVFPVELGEVGTWASYRSLRADQRVKFEREGEYLLCDLEDAELIYTKRITDPTKMPPSFIDAFAWSLAEELALALTAKRDLAEYCARRAEMAVSEAGAVDANSRLDDAQPESAIIGARR